MGGLHIKKETLTRLNLALEAIQGGAARYTQPNTTCPGCISQPGGEFSCKACPDLLGKK